MFFKEKVNDICHKLGSTEKRKSNREEINVGKSLLFLSLMDLKDNQFLELITMYRVIIAYG